VANLVSLAAAGNVWLPMARDCQFATSGKLACRWQHHYRGGNKRDASILATIQRVDHLLGAMPTALRGHVRPEPASSPSSPPCPRRAVGLVPTQGRGLGTSWQPSCAAEPSRFISATGSNTSLPGAAGRATHRPEQGRRQGVPWSATPCPDLDCGPCRCSRTFASAPPLPRPRGDGRAPGSR
jgi:hypothetical protein